MVGLEVPDLEARMDLLFEKVFGSLFDFGFGSWHLVGVAKCGIHFGGCGDLELVMNVFKLA